MADDQGNAKTRVKLVWIGVGLLAVVLLVVFAWMRPMAPRSLEFLSGPEGSSYHKIGLRFAEVLEPHGIRVRVVTTQGALDNLKRLNAGDMPAVGLAQSGVERELGENADVAELRSLGSLAFEPVWIFVRRDADIRRVADLRGRAVAIGRPGSGTRALADAMLEANGIKHDVQAPFPQGLDADQSVDAAFAEVDAVFVAGGIDGRAVSRLLSAENVIPLPIKRAKTYAALHPELAEFTVPMGAADLAKNIPAEDLELVAAATNLVTHVDLHDALIEALLRAARDVAGRQTLATPAGTFPSMQYTSLEVDRQARRFYEDGPSKLSRALPYWLSALLDQFLFVVLPALTLAFAVLKCVPLFLGLRFSLRDIQMCRQMVAIEHRLIEGAGKRELLDALAGISDASADMHVPPSKAGAYLELRQNVHDARERIEAYAASE